MDSLVCMGVIVATHGVKGRVKIKTYTENPHNFVSYGALTDKDARIYNIKITGEQPGNLLAEIEGIKSKDVAEELKGVELFVKRQDMPEPKVGSYYFQDLKGLQVRLQDRTVYGDVYSVQDYGAGVIIEIRRKNGKEESFTFDKETFPEVNIAENYAIFSPPEIIEGRK